MTNRVGSLLFALAMIGTTAHAGNFSKSPVGSPGGWAGTIAGTVLDGKIYTVESGGSLYATDPADGSWSQIGGADFANTAFLFAAENALASIEQDGTLYLINPADGSWQRPGPAGGWANTAAGAMLNGTLYTIESSGSLYASDPAAGTWRKVGEADFAATAFLFAAGGQLVAIEKSGNFYLINPDDGSWERTGDFAAWAGTAAGATLGGVLYTAETDGALVATDVASGTRQAVAEATPPAAAESPAAIPAPSTQEDEAQNDPARAGALTFQLMGQWAGDTAPLEQDPEFMKQKEAAPEMVQQVVDLMKGMKMSVTLDGITMEVMGEKAGPFAYHVVAGHDDTLGIEMDGGPKQGVRSRIVFSDPKHLQVIEVTPEGKAMFFQKP